MATKAQIKGGQQGRNSGYAFEPIVMSKKNGWEPTNMLDIWGERITTSKTDVITENYNYSIKNTKKSSTSTQIQVCSVDRFCRLFQIKGNLKVQFDQFFGNHGFFKDQELFKEHCQNVWGINPKKLSLKTEIRRNRILGGNLTNPQSVVIWFQENIRPVLEFALKTSFNNPINSEVIANRILWTKIKDCYETRSEFDIDPLIDSITANATVKVRPTGSVIEIGPVTLQMKGSGRIASAYHNMQFNASLNAINNF
tara:strand:- start:79 stop:840 length:762 start_codon:yes stop_codon:yes gene_type:complete